MATALILELLRAMRDQTEVKIQMIVQMALAFVNQRPFVASNIIGATNLDQLKANIDSIDLKDGHDIGNRHRHQVIGHMATQIAIGNDANQFPLIPQHPNTAKRMTGHGDKRLGHQRVFGRLAR